MKKKASIGAKEIGVIVLISFFLLLFFYAFFGEGSALDKLKAGVFSFGNRSPIKISIGQEPTDKEIEIPPKAKAVFEELDFAFKKWSESPVNNCSIHLNLPVNKFEEDHRIEMIKQDDGTLLTILRYIGPEEKGQVTGTIILTSEEPLPKLIPCTMIGPKQYSDTIEEIGIVYENKIFLSPDYSLFYKEYGANLLYKTEEGDICFIPTTNAWGWSCKIYNHILDFHCIDEIVKNIPDCTS